MAAAGMLGRETPQGVFSPDRHAGGSRFRPGAGRPAPRTPGTHRGSTGLGAALRRFWRGEHGGAAIETAIAMVILVVGFAGLMEIVNASYADDRMARAARATARSLALDPGADPDANACVAIRRELRLADDFDCNAEWRLAVYPGVSPKTLPAVLDGSATTGTGDMVLVRIGWDREPWSFGGPVRDANAADTPENDGDNGDDGDDGDGDDAEDPETMPMVAIGLARCELALCGQDRI